jgi:uncharacterized protein (TIRG00374 family)
MSTAARTRVPWHAIIIAVITAGLLWLFFRNIDIAETWRAMAQADMRLLAGAVLATLVTYVLRAFRWRALLRPIGNARLSTTFRATVIGFTTIFLLPGRVGEVLRAYLVARQEGMKFTATFATVIVERLLDVATVLLLFAASLPLLGIDVGREVKIAGLVAGSGAVAALVMLFFMAGHPERLGRWAGKLGRRLPARLATLLEQVVRTFADGLAVMRQPSDLLAAVAWSLPVWFSIAVGIWLTSLAFDLTLSFIGSFLVIGYLAVGVSAPTPGGAGGFHYFYWLALTQFFGADSSVAGAAAIILHAISFVPITFLGLYFMWKDGLTLGNLKRMRSEAQAAETP